MNKISRTTFAGTIEPSGVKSFSASVAALDAKHEHDEREGTDRAVTGGFVVGQDEFVLVLEGTVAAVEALVAEAQAVLRLGSLELLQRFDDQARRFVTSPFSILREDPRDDGMLARLYATLAAMPTPDIAALLVTNAPDLPAVGEEEPATVEPEQPPASAVGVRTSRASLDEVALRRELDKLLPGPPAAVVSVVTEPLVRHSHLQVQALDRAHCVLHLEVDGTISYVNELYLDLLGFKLADLVGKDYRILLSEDVQDRETYAAAWTLLTSGKHASGEFRRCRKDGSTVWLRSIYAPLIDDKGAFAGVTCQADDIAGEKLVEADFKSQINAIHKSHAVVTFDMHGIILDANDIFLQASHYTREEIVGRHHRMFVEPAYQHGREYAAFWRNLAQGQHQAGEFKRIGKNGEEIWLQASYNPIVDLNNKPIKVVKYATIVTEERQRQAEHQNQIAAIHKAQNVISFDLSGFVIDANDNFLATTGYKLSEVRGMHHRMFVAPAYAESEEYKAFWHHLAEGRHHSGEYRRFGKGGKEIWLQATYSPVFDMSGRPLRVVKYAIEVTAEKLRQVDFEGQIEAIRKSQCVITLDLDGTILDLNDKYLQALDYDLSDLKGQKHALIARLQEDDDAYRQFWATLRAGEFVSGVFKRYGRNGLTVWMQASYNAILDLNGNPIKVISYAADVTSNIALAMAFEDARRQAQHDPSTSLPNRARLSAYMKTALSHPRARLAVIFIDFDKFKPVNDTYGHAAGDLVLSEFADRLRCILGADQLAARVGGDEFVLVAPDLDDDQIASLCQQLIDLGSEPITYEGVEISVGISLGVAVSPEDGMQPDELLKHADAALYRSKQKGGRVFSFYVEATNDRVVAYRSLTADIERGIAANEFFVEYQPRFSAADRTIKRVEALVRWQHPERGRVPPNEFISSAEKSGAIVPLGEWVLRTACKAALSWPGVSVSVNLSAVQFRKAKMLDVVSAALRDTGLDAHRLELEITESVLLDKVEDLPTTLYALKRLGVTLAMDDFGTGYSSLSSLRSFPFDAIKIDRQFVADIGKRFGGRDVVRAIIGLARALTLSVTAEGVETEEQAMALVEDHCDELQGFLLARPLSQDEVATLIRTNLHAVA